MNKMIFGMAAGMAALIGLAVAGTADAAVVVKRTTVVAGRPHAGTRPYHQSYGVQYQRYHQGAPTRQAYYFSGHHHNHWGHRVWDTQYRRYQYWEPTLQVYYYYDAGQGGYYPCH